MDEEALTDSTPEGGAVDAHGEHAEEADSHTPDSHTHTPDSHTHTPEEVPPLKSSGGAGEAGSPEEEQSDAGGATAKSPSMMEQDSDAGGGTAKSPPMMEQDSDAGGGTAKDPPMMEQDSDAAAKGPPMMEQDSEVGGATAKDPPMMEQGSDAGGAAEEEQGSDAGGAGAEEPPGDWLEPLEEDDLEEEDEALSWGHTGSREGSVTGSTAGPERSSSSGPKRRRGPRVLLEENWDDCPCLGEGWKRKEVFRRSGCYMGKSDTYYMSPTGVRVRSKVELAKCLSRSVDLHMFDFKSGQFYSGPKARKRGRRVKSDQSQEEDQLLEEKELPPAAKRKRSRNFSDVEKRQLRQLVLSFPAAQRSAALGASWADRRQAWAEICQRFNHAAETPRTLQQLKFLWSKESVAARRKRGPRARDSRLAKLRRCEENKNNKNNKKRRRRRRVQPPQTTATAAAMTSPPPSPSPPPLLPPRASSSPLRALPAPPSPEEAHAPLPYPVLIKQESTDTLITNAYTLSHTPSHAPSHTLSHADTHLGSGTTGSYSADPAPSNSPQRRPSNSPSSGGQAARAEEMQPSGSTESSGSSSPPCGVSAPQRRQQRRRDPRDPRDPALTLSDQLALAFHRQRMRFLRQEHELHMRVLQLELDLLQQRANQGPALTPAANQGPALTPAANQGPALTPAANQGPALTPAANQGPALTPAANQGPALTPTANQGPALTHTANQSAASTQTTNHRAAHSKTANQSAVYSKTANQSAAHSKTANQLPDDIHSTSPEPLSPAPSLANQKQTANALLALIAGTRRRTNHAPPSKPPYPATHKRHGNKQAGRKGAGSKSHAPSAPKKRGRVKSV